MRRLDVYMGVPWGSHAIESRLMKCTFCPQELAISVRSFRHMVGIENPIIACPVCVQQRWPGVAIINDPDLIPPNLTQICNMPVSAIPLWMLGYE